MGKAFTHKESRSMKGRELFRVPSAVIPREYRGLPFRVPGDMIGLHWKSA